MKTIITTTLALLTLVATAIAPAPAMAQTAAPGPRQPDTTARLLASDAMEIVVELTPPAFTVVDDTVGGVTCQRIVIDHASDDYAQSAITGAPQLPEHVQVVGVPVDGDLHVTISALESDVAHTGYRACPAPEIVVEWDGLIPDGDDNSASYYVERDAEFDPAVYMQPGLYPAQPARLDGTFFLRSQRAARLLFAPFQVDPVAGALYVNRRIVATVTVDAPQREQPDGERAAPVVEPPEVDRLLTTLLINGESARAWRGQSAADQVTHAITAGQDSVTVSPWSVPQSAWRIFLTDSGFYRLTYDDLMAAGVNVADIRPDNLRMFYNGKEIAIEVAGAGDGTFDAGDQIVFYAQSTDERYAAANVYWLALGSRAGKRMAMRPSVTGANASPAQAYMETIRIERNLNYVSSLPMEPGYDHWYAGQLTAVGPGGARTLKTPLVLSHVAPEGGDATLTMTLGGNIKGRHHVKFYVNEVEVLDAEWQNRTYRKLAAEFDTGLLKEGLNFIELELINDTPDQTLDMVYVDWVSLDYPRDFVAGDGQFFFNGPGPGLWSYDISGLGSDDAKLFDITDTAAVGRIDATAQGGQLVFGDSQPNARRYAIATPEQMLAPLGMEAASVDNLATGSADYIMIAPRAFFDALQPLVDHRAGQGYRVRLVDLQAVYDQFAYGRTSAEGIRAFLAHTYQHWTKPAPNFVLLVGDGTFDPKRYLETSTETILPPYLAMVDPALGETAADNRFVMVSGDDLVADMHLGRFPARNVADVAAMVAKTISYEQMPADQSWLQNLLFIADDLEGGGGAFQNYSNEIADGETTTLGGEVVPLVPVDYNKTKLYLGDHCPDGDPALECRQNIVDEINDGVFFVSYIGHGSKQFWAAEQLLNLSALSEFDNADRLPIMLPMTCLEGFFHDAGTDKDAFGESIVRMDGGGAVASWSPTGLGLVSGHDYLEKGFMLAIFHYGFREIGFATHYGKMRLVTHGPSTRYDDLLDTFMLFGDPALRMNYEPDAVAQKIFLPLVNKNQ